MKRILVVGDFIEDHYKWCKVPRMCPEAPAPVLVVESEEWRLGGAANVAHNIQTLSGDEMAVFSLTSSTSIKTRYFCGNRLMFRKDADSVSVSNPANFLETVKRTLSEEDFEAIIISDYNKGGISDRLANHLVSGTYKNVPIFVDAKCPHPEVKYKGAFCIFPNEDEHPNLKCGIFGHIIRKLGPKGCSVDGTLVPTTEQPVFDVTGAGDTFIAAFVLKFVQDWAHFSMAPIGTDPLADCASFANKAAGISVRHIGTYAVTQKDLDGN